MPIPTHKLSPSYPPHQAGWERWWANWWLIDLGCQIQRKLLRCWQREWMRRESWCWRLWLDLVFKIWVSFESFLAPLFWMSPRRSPSSFFSRLCGRGCFLVLTLHLEYYSRHLQPSQHSHLSSSSFHDMTHTYSFHCSSWFGLCWFHNIGIDVIIIILFS